MASVAFEEQVSRTVAERQRLAKGTATVERLVQAGEGGTEVDPSGRQRVVAAPLDRLDKQGFITSREFQAGDKYRSDHFVAGLDPSAPTVDWGRAIEAGGARSPSMFNSQRIADTRVDLRHLREKIPDRSIVSSVLFIALVKEQPFIEIGRLFGISDQREATIAGKVGLRVALAALADVYGS